MKAEPQQDGKWSTASLGIYGEPLDLARITELLGLLPTRSGRKGDIRTSPRVKLPPRRNSFWLLTSPLPDSAPLQDHLQWLIEQLEPKCREAEKLAQEYMLKFICGFSSENGQGGCTFDADLLARLAKFRLPLVLDLYPPGPIPEQDSTESL
jgi:hypothetical protein